MGQLNPDEARISKDYEAGRLKSVATKTEFSRFRAAAKATSLKDRRVNIRLSSADLALIQSRALEEGLPYQTLMASVLHKYATDRLTEPARRQK